MCIRASVYNEIRALLLDNNYLSLEVVFMWVEGRVNEYIINMSYKVTTNDQMIRSMCVSPTTARFFRGFGHTTQHYMPYW